MAKLELSDLDVSGKRVLVRVQSHSVFKFSLYFREDRDSEIAPTEERLEHQMRTTGQLNGSGARGL